jgi:DNA-directed RNA polymerase subunit RPC12/RpoP
MCTRKHIKNPIPEGDWLCPKCGSKEGFACWDADLGCDLDHIDDYASCTECGYGVMLGKLTKKYWEIKNTVWIKCPHCNGTGEIKNNT